MRRIKNNVSCSKFRALFTYATKTSTQPHVIDWKGRPQSQAAFPVCIYDGGQDGYEVDKDGYGGNAYCNMFQTTFNEHGMCYTYNNYELSLDKVGKGQYHKHPMAKEGK